MRFIPYLRDTPRGTPSEIKNAPPGTTARKVLILTAAAGGGHEAAGKAIRAELEQDEYSVVMVDGLRVMSRTLNWLLVRGYARQVKYTPRSMRVTFALTSHRRGAKVVQIIVSLLFATRLLEIVQKEQPDLVVSTYPLVTAALGHLRNSNRLRVPVAAAIADYGVHPLWVVPSADLHLVVSRPSEELVRRARGSASLIRLPVAPSFRKPPARDEARVALEIPQDAFVVLIVGGAWGVGNLEGATRCVVASGVYVIVVTGNNEELKTRLEAKFRSEENVRVLGWREDMSTLMAAADCLIQNAGGMTCVEAAEMNLPMLTFDPIPGHGKLNAEVMEWAGVAQWVRSAEELTTLLQLVIEHKISLPPPNREPSALRVSTILESLITSAPQPVFTRQIVRPRLVLVSVTIVLLCCWLASSSPGMALAAKALRLRILGCDSTPAKSTSRVKLWLEQTLRKARRP